MLELTMMEILQYVLKHLSKGYLLFLLFINFRQTSCL